MIWESLKIIGLLFSCGEVQCVGRTDVTQNRIHQNQCAGHASSGEDGLFLQHVDSGHEVLFPLKDPSYE